MTSEVSPWATPAGYETASRRPWSVRAIAFALVGLFAVLTFVLTLGVGAVGYRVYDIPSASMAPTLPVGSYIVVREWDGHQPARGQIVVFHNRLDPALPDATFVKRVVAVGGDRIACCDSGRIKVNGQPVDEPYVHGSTLPFAEHTVPSGSIWVLGDNRPASADSRVYGAVPDSRVVGRAVLLTRSHLRALAVPFLVAAAIAAAMTVTTGLVLADRDRRSRGDRPSSAGVT